MTNYAWYALHVRPRFEKLVQKRLEGQFETFLPTYSSPHPAANGSKTLSLPLFPAHLFCRFAPYVKSTVMVTPGVRSVVGVVRPPVAVAESEITSIRLVVQYGLTPRPWPYINEGEQVRVIAGPLDGVTGVLVRHNDIDLLVCSITVLMRSVCTAIDRRHIARHRHPTPGKT